MNAENPGSCPSCKFETDELERFPVFPMSWLGRTGQTEKWLCSLCANSLAGVAFENPDQYEHAALYGVVCNVGNAILKALRQTNEGHL